ncbi:acyl-CoA thioester hydrolase [Comamonas sp. BIGb0124]|uniref:tol-pal system-associated acyl-CoA thioesterase n=1 Tax=Comamonas sp. BIGb0124 TaxID=2485130 RepID=UPI000F47D70F|nr:tol-pal system-associated acyl-CoA thioesterase [Comamonas sp. BIGb0124]ROR26468.1 acyl-CoA thioester hydrolase [Comamonas sp. BIGb0124]
MSEAPDFSWPVRVYWEDTDAGGIVFYANYLKYFERARTEWLRHRGQAQQALKDQHGAMFVVTECQLRYLRPARLDDTLEVTVQCIETGRASLLLRQQTWKTRPGIEGGKELLCEGTVRIGWVDAYSMRPSRLPASVLASLDLNC